MHYEDHRIRSSSPSPASGQGIPRSAANGKSLGEHGALIGADRDRPQRHGRNLGDQVTGLIRCELSCSCRHRSPALRASSKIRRPSHPHQLPPPSMAGRPRPRLGVVHHQQHRHAAVTGVPDRVRLLDRRAPTTTATPGL